MTTTPKATHTTAGALALLKSDFLRWQELYVAHRGEDERERRRGHAARDLEHDAEVACDERHCDLDEIQRL